MNQFNLIDLFAGCGGLTEGFVSSKSYNTLAVVEWEKYPLETLKTRLLNKWGYSDEEIFVHYDIQDTKGLLEGIKKDGFDSEVGLKSLVGNNNVDLIVGGPPCQAYSLAGRAQDKFGMQKDYRNYLFESFAKLVQIYSPNFFVFENVPGILSAKPGDILITERIRTVFESIGYEISTDLKKEALIDISYYGVPQVRKRVIIFGTKKNNRNKIPKFYEALHNKKRENQEVLKNHLEGMTKFKPKKTDKNMIVYEPIGENSLSNNTPRTHSIRDANIFEILAKDIESGNFKYSSTQSKKELYFEKTGKISNFHKYHVLEYDKPSNTIPAHLHKDGLCHIHPDSTQKRSITPREAARIQSFPDDFIFTGPMTANYKMIGNAVPPKFSKSIADSLLEVL
jgi:DNA (cytosine-5)-methyltransferase 1